MIQFIMSPQAWILLFLFQEGTVFQSQSGEANRFVGTESCKPCHPAAAKTQLGSNMARAASRPEEHPLFDRLRTLQSRRMGLLFESAWKEGRLEVLVSDERKSITIPVQWAFGAGTQGVTFFSLVAAGLYLEHRLSYYRELDGFDLTPGQQEIPFRELEEASGHLNNRSEAFRCISCHTTSSTNMPQAEDIVVGELGVRCEACHGPGLWHIEAVKKQNWEAARGAVQNPARYSPRQVLEHCGRCHRRPPQDPATIQWEDPATTRFQPVGLNRSRCFSNGKGSLSCLTCHDAHSNARRDPPFYNRVCAGCHSRALRSPSQACASAQEGGCIGCHMPKVSALPHMKFTNHWIGIYGSDRVVPRIR